MSHRRSPNALPTRWETHQPARPVTISAASLGPGRACHSSRRLLIRDLYRSLASTSRAAARTSDADGSPLSTILPIPSRCTLSALMCWSAPNGRTTSGTVASIASRTVPYPPWQTTREQRSSNARCGRYLNARMDAGNGPRDAGSTLGPTVRTTRTGSWRKASITTGKNGRPRRGSLNTVPRVAYTSGWDPASSRTSPGISAPAACERPGWHDRRFMGSGVTGS